MHAYVYVWESTGPATYHRKNSKKFKKLKKTYTYTYMHAYVYVWDSTGPATYHRKN